MSASLRPLLPILSLALLGGLPASATVNHGDFDGTQVDFLAVSETTQTAGDPEPIWDAPTLSVSGDQLLFFPSSFISSCNTPGTSDVTASELTTRIVAEPGVHIETIRLQEAGDFDLLQLPPFGTPNTNVGAAVSGTATVVEDIGGPIVPVVIPFTGTFTPSDRFELPDDFGNGAWIGDIDVDIASVVPNATVVDFAITNTLDANCDAGGGVTDALIQKKAVSGPAVALMVNPLLCDIDVDKTCCVTQPVLPDLGLCEGDVVRLLLEYTGDKCARSSNDQGRAFRCYGRREIGEPADVQIVHGSGNVSANPSTGVNIGDVVEITSSTGTLDSRTKIKTIGSYWRRQLFKLDTSCDRALQCGDQFGAYEVVGYESTLGGFVDCSAPPPPPVCEGSGDAPGTPCDAKLVDMVLEYNGSACQDPLANPQNGEAACDGNATGASNVGVIYTGKHRSRQHVSPASGINDGDRIRVTATRRGGLFPNQSYKIVDSAGVLQTIDFHVSCSQPLALGDEFGSFTLVGFTTKNGTTAELGVGGDGRLDACEVPLAPPGPHCTSDLQELTLVYIGDFLGEGCTVSNPQYGYAGCSGVDDPGDLVTVSAPGLVVDPDDELEFGDLITITSPGGGDLPGITGIDVTGPNGTQWIDIKTSCWKPLSLGDRFGSLVVFGMDREADGPITLGGNVQYQYEVFNPNASSVVDVQVDDDQLGVVVSGETLAPGESKIFTVDATLFGTTTNVATASANLSGSGAICEPGVDQVTIGVTAPPPGSFHCSEPITELTLIWDGNQTVDIKAWDGPVGDGLGLGVFNDIAPGEAIEVDGLAGNGNLVLEIFDITRTVKQGESHFDLWCQDWAMNGLEDCGKRNGNLKTNEPLLIDDWLLEGMVDTDEELICTPSLVPDIGSECGFGPELVLVMPGLMWWHRRRQQRRS